MITSNARCISCGESINSVFVQLCKRCFTAQSRKVHGRRTGRTTRLIHMLDADHTGILICASPTEATRLSYMYPWLRSRILAPCTAADTVRGLEVTLYIDDHLFQPDSTRDIIRERRGDVFYGD